MTGTHTAGAPRQRGPHPDGVGWWLPPKRRRPDDPPRHRVPGATEILEIVSLTPGRRWRRRLRLTVRGLLERVLPPQRAVSGPCG